MPQCEATARTPGRPNYGGRCGRSAVTGSKFCERHGGLDDTATPDATRQRWDRPRVRCTARKRNGDPCSKWAIQGGNVCRTHGGHMANVKESARERLMGMQADALQRLADTINDPLADPSVRLRASLAVLDRTGYGPGTNLTVEVKPFEKAVGRIFKKRSELTEAEEPEAEPVMLALPAGTWTYDDAEDDEDEPPFVQTPEPPVEGSRNPPPHLR